MRLKFKGAAKNLVQILEKANLNGEWAVVISKSANIATQNITKDEIIALDIAPKAKAKLLSKINWQGRQKDIRRAHKSINLKAQIPSKKFQKFTQILEAK